jgi:predicted ATPase
MHGVPLYVEELTKMLLESALLREDVEQYVLIGPLTTLAIPDTLQDSLMARLDQMNTAKEVAQLGAVIGREFAYDMIQAVSSQDGEMLQTNLDKLVEAELLYQRGRPPRARYIFKHALIQDAAYASLLRNQRQQYHQRIGQVLEKQFPETTENQPELLAHHYTEAGLNEQATDYWYKAGQQSSSRSALIEAESQLTKGLGLIPALADSSVRVERELAFQTTLGPIFMATRGYASEEVERTYGRARELCQQLGNTPQVFDVLWGLRSFYNVRADFRTARELMEEFLRLAEERQDSDLIMQGQAGLANALWFSGEFQASLRLSTQSFDHYDPDQHRFYIFRQGQYIGVFSQFSAMLVQWVLGHPQQAL